MNQQCDNPEHHPEDEHVLSPWHSLLLKHLFGPVEFKDSSIKQYLDCVEGVGQLLVPAHQLALEQYLDP